MSRVNTKIPRDLMKPFMGIFYNLVLATYNFRVKEAFENFRAHFDKLKCFK